MKKRTLLSVLLLSSTLFVAASCNNGESSTTEPTSSHESSTTTTSSSAPAVTGLVIASAGNVRTISVGDTLQLTVTSYPAGASSDVTWSSSDTTVATVSSAGLVTGVMSGNVTITATSVENTSVTATFALVIERGETPAPTAITVTASTTSIKIGETLSLVASVTPENATRTVTWTSSNTAVATVSTNGTVTGLSVGSVVITATSTEDTNVSGSIALTIEQGDQPVQTGDWDEMGYTSHADYIAAESNTTKIKVKGKVLFVSNLSEGKVNYIIQNGSEGFYVYAQDYAAFPVEVGKVYEVGGYKAYYRGLHEIKNVEHFVELDEEITVTPADVNSVTLNSLTDTTPYNGCYVTFSGGTLVSNSTNTSSYNITVRHNGVNVTVRVDTTFYSDEALATLNEKVAAAAIGAPVTIRGVMAAFGYGTPSPQVLLLTADDFMPADLTPEIIVAACKETLSLPATIEAKTTSITLPTTNEYYPTASISYEVDKPEIIDVTTGTVTHETDDTLVSATATIKCENVTDTKTFTINVLGSAFEENNTLVHTLDFEDADPETSYGCSLTKSGYDAAVVTLGTPSQMNWNLDGVLIGGDGNDHFNGTFGGRGIYDTKIQLVQDLATAVDSVEFKGCMYGSYQPGYQLQVKYVPEGTTTVTDSSWKTVDFVVSLEQAPLAISRIKLPEKASRVSIEGNTTLSSGTRFNIDDIKLYSSK